MVLNPGLESFCLGCPHLVLQLLLFVQKHEFEIWIFSNSAEAPSVTTNGLFYLVLQYTRNMS